MTHDGITASHAHTIDVEEPLLLQVSSVDGPPLTTLSDDGHFDEVVKFTTAHNLAHKVDLFGKAATLLQGEVQPDRIPTITTLEISALHNETRRKWRQPWTLYLTIFVCSLGAIEQGTAQTSMNGANLYFPDDLGIGSDSAHDNFVVGLINSGIYLSVGVW
jgi:hypothetical protein